MPAHVATRADDADKHTSDVNGLVYVNGKLYSGGNDGKIKVWAEDLTKLGEVQAHEQPVFSITAGPDAIYSCSSDGTVKSWELNSLEPKAVVVKEANTEYWSVRYADGVLYASDDQCNVLVKKDGKTVGMVLVAEPVKDMAIYKNILFTVKDTDVSVTELVLGDKLHFSSQAPICGRGPLALIGNKLAFCSREEKDILVYQTTHEGHTKPYANKMAAHGMIINAMVGVQWDGDELLFSGGWDKMVKGWKLSEGSLSEQMSANVDIVVNALTVGDKGTLYAAGGDGHIVRVDL